MRLNFVCLHSRLSFALFNDILFAYSETALPLPPLSAFASFCLPLTIPLSATFMCEKYEFYVLRDFWNTRQAKGQAQREKKQRDVERGWEEERQRAGWREKKRRKTCFLFGLTKSRRAESSKRKPPNEKNGNKNKNEKKQSTKTTVECARLWYTFQNDFFNI